MTKRFWALFLAVMMVVSVLPTTAFADAADEPVRVPSVSTPDGSPVKITKSVGEKNNDGTYTLSMEAYVTGQVVTTNPEPLDIVLVLDVSGSMKDDISIVKEENVTYSPVANREPIRFFLLEFDTNTNSYVCSDWENGGEYWYSEDGETFYPVTKIERKERKELVANIPVIGEIYDTYVHYEYTYTVNDEDRVYATQEHKSGILSNAADNEVVQRIYYKTVKTEIQTVSKMKALQDAVKEFISATAEKNQNVDAASQHRISIVKFAGDTTDAIGNLTYESGRYQYNYSQIVKELTVVDETGAKTLSDTVDELQAAGATAADYGMAHAKTVLNNRHEGEETRKQVVIFFTDGEPNHGNGFNGTVANDTIKTAKDLKDGGATIYTIGVFAGANPDNSQSDANKFMHAVSSNYPNASAMNKLGDRADGSNYYKTATTKDDLTGIFGDIAEDMIPDVTAGSTSVLTDTVSGWFTAPNDFTGVTVEVYQASGNGKAPVWTEDETFNTTDIKATVSGQKISVTGFDYSANALARQQDGSWTGKKLVISFAIAPNAAANWKAGTHQYPTNVAGDVEEDNAGLYPESGEAFASLDRSPDVPITAYSVTYSYNKPTPADAPKVPDTKAYLPGTEVRVADAPEFDGYNFDGWYKEGTKATGVITVDSNITLTGSWSENPPATVTVTFDANGGAWDEAVKDYTMGTENKTASKDVAIGSKLAAIDTEPVRSDFTFKGWYTDAQCTEEVNFNYAYAYSAVTLYADWAPATPNTVNYTVRQHYINAQGEDALAVNVINASAAAGTKIVNLISSMEQDYNDDSNDIHYIYVQANTKLNSAALIRETAVLSANDVIDLYYYQDIWNDDKDATNEGDNIPDMYQAVVKFMPGDPWGTVTGDGTTQVFTLMNNDTGANATSGTVTPDMTNVTVRAKEGFAFDIWTKDKDETAVQPVQAWTVSGGNTITFYAHFDTDVIGGVNGGDGIPDKYQVTVKYEAINGSIISTPISEVLTIRNAAGQLVTSGTVTISGAEAESEKGDFNGWTSNNAVDLSSEDDTLSSLEINAVGGATYTFTASFGEVVSAENIHKAVVPNMIEVENIAIPEGITYPGTDNAGNVLPVIAKAGDQVTLLYAITVTGGQGDVFAVTEEVGTTFIGSTGCKLAATMSIPAQYVGTLDNTTPTTNNVTATLYFTKTFTITADTEKLTNSIVLHDDTTKEEEVPVLVPGIAVEKTVNKTSVTVGDTVKYTITVKNTGNVDLTNVNVVEAFGGDFSKITNVTGADLVTKNGFVIRELKAGSDPVEITFSYKTTKRETLTNSVVVEGTYEPGKTVRDEDSSAPVTVKSEPITPVGPSKPQLNYEDHYAYVVGYPDGLVHPERNITRAEVATIFFRMLLDESREYFWAQENDFSDVAETDWFNNAVSTLANALLINGYPDGSYRPNANITRAEFATIAIRFFLDEDVEIEENNLSDVKGHWAEANINLAYALELINGYPDGTFRPDQKITRAEAMAIVNRVLKRAPEKDHLLKDMIEWPDNLNTAAWYYADVQEATNSHKFHMDKEEEYEIWTELLPVRDWVALEQEWSKANSSKNPGEVVDIKITTPEAGDNGLKLD